MKDKLNRILEETDSFKRKICIAEPVRELYLDYLDLYKLSESMQETLRAINHCTDLEHVKKMAKEELNNISP